MRVTISVEDRSSTGQRYHATETFDLTYDQVIEVNMKRMMGVATWVRACCDIDLEAMAGEPWPGAAIREAESPKPSIDPGFQEQMDELLHNQPDE